MNFKINQLKWMNKNRESKADPKHQTLRISSCFKKMIKVITNLKIKFSIREIPSTNLKAIKHQEINSIN
jgi:NADH dehydrogenase/NADH:ubiquinone oxidoreductase subunit G